MKLFISYRRKSWAFTQRLDEALTAATGADIFVDYEGIDDTHFEESILRHLGESDAVLLIITEYTFAPERINQPDDWVRREIVTALKLKKPIVLVAVDGLYPPPPDKLPEDIREIAKLEGVEFYPRFFDAGVQELARFVSKLTGIKVHQKRSSNPALMLVGVLAVVVLVIVALVIFLPALKPDQPSPTMDEDSLIGSAQAIVLLKTVHAETEHPPTLTPTNTVPPTVTNTATIPPSDTPLPGVSGPVIAATLVPSSTPVPPTATPTNTLTPSATPTVLNTADLFPSPTKIKFRVIREYGDTTLGTANKSVSLADPPGTQITSGGNGFVTLLGVCTKCTPQTPNFMAAGIPLNDTSAFQDPAWGFGFGNNIIIRYAYNDLPVKARAALDSMKLTGGYAFVLYAHLNKIDDNLKPGATISAGTPLGLSGNTGNTTGPNLHLEVRVGSDGSTQNIYGLPAIDPRSLFSL